ncbi:16S rRNA (uracil(1498)-N(3))-methyltransferase [Fulvivirga ligni]|uniref:16S rRNA (uracil(1498)-N(3))-methyltransferase n=1 Tax=Fulvivirga ligni TaxID=2904246 RepID=UPI001F431E3E|nr:16S rRNA (uracil(1498)-N(3))-methyltransferase [Fulvivirga ligni]UII23959.1 16S rRNA (uracil(1498)-N(3))-methyltransferase [Fulvivirga ligni]
MPLFYQPDIPSGIHHLDEEESRHCVKVLRHSIGDEIELIDGAGGYYKARITNNHHKKCEFDIIDSSQAERPSYTIHIAISPTKNMDRIEWFIEKAVEIGLQEVSFILTKNSERRVLKTERVIKKAISAMKQSGQRFMTTINEMNSLTAFLNEVRADEKFIAFVDKENPDQLFKLAQSGKNTCILIGPEGDFTANELKLAQECDFRKVALGNSTLRTETAGLVACHSLNLLNMG